MVLSGVLALLIDPLRFVRRLRHRFARVHRFLGATYVASATVLGVSGLILAPTAYTGLVASAGFTVLGPGHAVHHLDGGADDLGRPVRRASALDDPQLLPDHGGSHVAGMDSDLRRACRTGIVDFSFETEYATIAWPCWVPNLLLAIWFTRDPAGTRL
jgi:hypothetical protein